MNTSEDTNAKRDDTIVSNPEILGGMPVTKGTRVPVYDLAASVKAGIPRDRILAAYPTIKEYHLDLAVAYAEANPLQRRALGLPPWPSAALVRSGQIPRRKG
jgi:uncharacterized protein (DUF433 family)